MLTKEAIFVKMRVIGYLHKPNQGFHTNDLHNRIKFDHQVLQSSQLLLTSERVHIGALSVKGILCHRTVDIDADELSSQNASEFHLKSAQKPGESIVLSRNVTAHACPSFDVGSHNVIPCPF